jgi:hypothetical protein
MKHQKERLRAGNPARGGINIKTYVLNALKIALDMSPFAKNFLIDLFFAVSVFWFATAVASYWVAFETCTSASGCYMNWVAPFLLFSIHGDINDANFLFTTLGGLWLLVSGILLGHRNRP